MEEPKTERAGEQTPTTAETVREQTGETRIDYNALDNTTGGRLLQAAFAVAFTAVPDYARSKPARLASWAAVAAAFTGTVAVFNAFDEDPRNDLTARVEHTAETGSPAKTWALLGGVLALTIGGARLSIAVQNKFAGALRRRGAKRPNTLLGLIVGALVFAGSEAVARFTAS